jgi:hypothetical protein
MEVDMSASQLRAVSQVGALIACALVTTSVFAQQPQIPTVQVCNGSRVEGGGMVKLDRRSDAQHQGTFQLKVLVKCGVPGYPAGGFDLKVDMSDSLVQGIIRATTVEQLTSTGKHTPAAYLNGRCDAEGVKGCRYWLMLSDNGKPGDRPPDVIGFLVLNGDGKRVAYGTGPLVDGDIFVEATSN